MVQAKGLVMPDIGLVSVSVMSSGFVPFHYEDTYVVGCGHDTYVAA